MIWGTVCPLNCSIQNSGTPPNQVLLGPAIMLYKSGGTKFMCITIASWFVLADSTIHNSTIHNSTIHDSTIDDGTIDDSTV